jgi:broad specificity phosphatase PhoE
VKVTAGFASGCGPGQRGLSFGMRWLEVRRHSLTKMGERRGSGSHLSAQGVALARAVGAELGAFAYVLTSTSPRTIETAVAMGYAVDETAELPDGYVPGEVNHHDQWSWPKPYVAYASLIRRGGGLNAVVEAHRAAWVRVIENRDDHDVALIISHGGAIEPTLVACLPEADHASWGAPFAHCDGARLAFDNDRFVGVEFIRAPLVPLHQRSWSISLE